MMPTSRGTDVPVRILIVCTGNICRSPYAEFVLRRALRDIDAEGFVVRSAGTRALRGHPIDDSSAVLLGASAGATATFTASQLTTDDVARHDVILTMSREQRSTVLRLRPDALRRTFTLREFARLLDTVDPQDLPATRGSRWRSLVPALAANRTSARITDPTEDDVVDPFRLGAEVFSQMAQEISPALERIVEFERASLLTAAPAMRGHHAE